MEIDYRKRLDPLMAASIGVMPSSFFKDIFVTTIPSSTTKPVEQSPIG
jgi:hypothetical protein